MKGTSFQNGVEYKIEVKGEAWSPGEMLSGTLTTKPAASAQIFLAEGVDKKVKAKSADAFIVLHEVESQKAPFDWQIPLEVSARISDTKGSLYLLYGSGDAIEKQGQLRLNVVPHVLLRDFSDLMVAEFRFANPQFSHGKSKTTELKLDPPGLKEWTFLDQLVIGLALGKDSLSLRFQFDRREVDPGKGGLTTKSVKREMSRELKRSQMVHDFNGRLNKDAVAEVIRSVIEEYKAAGWLSTS